MKRLKNKNVGAKVLVCKLLVEISPKVKWRKIKNIGGVIVDMGDHKFYYHICDGWYEDITKMVVDITDCRTFAIKLDDGITDIAGNNIVVIRDWDLKFLDFLPSSVKIISFREYRKAKKLIKEYYIQQTLF